MTHVEIIKLAGCGAGGLIDLPDELAHLLLEGFDHGVHLPFRSFHHQFDAPIGEVPNETGDRMTRSDLLRSIAKADALDVAGEEVSSALHAKRIVARRSVGFNCR